MTKTPQIPGKRTGPNETCEIRGLQPGGYIEIVIGKNESKASVRSRVIAAAAYRKWKITTRTDEKKHPGVLRVWREPFVYENR